MANVLILAFCQAMLMAGASLLISSSALVGRMLAPDPGLATVPLGLQFLATTATTIPASLLMARIGRRAGFALGVGLGVAGAAGCALAVLWGSFWLFCLGAVAVGACNGFGVFYRFAAVEAVPEPLHSRAVSWVLAGGILAAFIGPNLASAGQHWWSTAFLGSFVGLAGLYLLSLLALVPLRLARPVVSRAEGPARPLRVVMSQPLLLVSMFAAMVAYGLMNLVMTATPLAMTDVGMPFAEAAFVIQWHLLGMFVPSFFTGSLIARIGHRPVMTLGGLAIAGCMLVNLGGGGVWQ